MRFIAVVVLSMLAVPAATVDLHKGCPSSNWWKYCQLCLLYPDVTATFSEAKEYCRAQGGELARMDVGKDEFCAGVFATKFKVECAWVGATDEAKEGEWVSTMTNKPLSYDLTWGAGEPSKNANANCACLSKQFQMASKDCSSKRRFLCTRDSKD